MFEGAGWVHLFQPAPIHDRYSIRMVARTAEPMVFGYAIADVDGGTIGAVIRSGRATEVVIAPPGIRGETEALRNDVIDGPLPWNSSTELAVSGPEKNGPTEFLFWAVGGASSWSYEIRSSHGEGIVEVARSTDPGYFWDGGETIGGLHTHAAIHGAGAFASSASYEFDVQSEFIGIAGNSWQPLPAPTSWPPAELDDVITVLHPDGREETCACTAGPHDPWTAGRYHMAWHGVGVHAMSTQAILLAGFDLDFPAMR